MATITIPGMFLTGDHASRPAATAVGGGTLYACSDHSLIYQSDGATWSTWADLSTGTPTEPAWTDFTPAWTATSVNPAIVSGTLSGRYLTTGKSHKFSLQMVAAADTTFGTGRWDFGLGGGVSTAATTTQVVPVYLFDTSAGTGYAAIGWIAPAATPVMRVVANATTGNGIDGTKPFTWATGDAMRANGVIEVA